MHRGRARRRWRRLANMRARADAPVPRGAATSALMPDPRLRQLPLTSWPRQRRADNAAHAAAPRRQLPHPARRDRRRGYVKSRHPSGAKKKIFTA